jgi:hypothetical protein
MKRGLLSIALILISLNFISATDCPIGLENDSYPGSCGKYVDTNKDNICDLSQDIYISSQQNPEINTTTFYSKIRGRYNFIPITIICIIIYGLSIILVKKNKITYIIHKKIWNILLLITFIITALTSVAYLLRADLAINIPFIANISFLHIEIGLVMILISIFHALWHIPYFKSYLPRCEEC